MNSQEFDQKLEAMQTRVDELLSEVRSEIEKNETSESENKVLRGTLEELKRKESELEEKVAGLLDASKAEREEVESLMEHNRNLKAKLAEVEQELSLTRENIAHTEKKYVVAIRKVSSLRDIKKDLNEKLEIMQKETTEKLKSLEEKYTIDLQQAQASRKQDLLEKATKIDRQKEKIGSLRDANLRATDEVKEITRKLQEAESNLEIAFQRISEMETKAKITAKYLDSLEAEKNELNRKFQDSQLEISELKAENSHLHSKKLSLENVDMVKTLEIEKLSSSVALNHNTSDVSAFDLTRGSPSSSHTLTLPRTPTKSTPTKSTRTQTRSSPSTPVSFDVSKISSPSTPTCASSSSSSATAITHSPPSVSSSLFSSNLQTPPPLPSSTQTPVVMMSGVEKDEKKRLTIILERMGGKVRDDEISSETTHVVSGANSRTVKTMAAILCRR